MTLTATVQVPAKATLMIHTDAPGIEPREATPDDLKTFGLIDKVDGYGSMLDDLLEFLGVEDSADLSDIGSMLRYVIECGLLYEHKAFDPQGTIHVAPGSPKGAMAEATPYVWTEPDGDTEEARAEERRVGFLVAHLRAMLTQSADERRYGTVGAPVPAIPTGA